MSEETGATGSIESHDGSEDCGGWYTTHDPASFNRDDSETELERERQILEEERNFEELYTSLEHPRGLSRCFHL